MGLIFLFFYQKFSFCLSLWICLVTVKTGYTQLCLFLSPALLFLTCRQFRISSTARHIIPTAIHNTCCKGILCNQLSDEISTGTVLAIHPGGQPEALSSMATPHARVHY